MCRDFTYVTIIYDQNAILSQMDFVEIINLHPQKLQASQHQFLDVDTKRFCFM